MSTTAEKRTRKPKGAAQHPKYADMIIAAMKGMKEQGGTSRQKIVKYIGANYKVGNRFEVQVSLTIKKMLLDGLLNQARGKGTAGSFRLPAIKATAATKKRQSGTKQSLKERGTKKPKRAAKKTSKKGKATDLGRKGGPALSKRSPPTKKPRTQSKRKTPKKSGRKTK